MVSDWNTHVCKLEVQFLPPINTQPFFRQNNVEELYSLLHFLGIRPLNDWATFRDSIAMPIKSNRPGIALKRLHVGFCSNHMILDRLPDTSLYRLSCGALC